MIFLRNMLVCALLLFLVACDGEYSMKEGTSNGYTYQYVPSDPLKTRIYTLKNGLDVYLSAYKATPRVYAAIAVRAGSKLDPATHTGLAHYLEHMLFKGTWDFGTQNAIKEKVLLDSIERMFAHYGALTDPEERRAYYTKIDTASNEAAKYAIPNEYDRMLTSMGATGTNAYTSSDRTVYTNSIPTNQLKTYLEVEANRFRTLVPRLFHTELETVYEEKNRGLDSDGIVAFEALLEKLFPNHPYGTQTVIGTVEHLKNPSITHIKKYFDAYYRPNNIAICLSGDLDYDETIAWIDEAFGSMEPNPELQAFVSPVATAPTSAIEEVIFGPEEESVYIGYLLPGMGKEDYVKALVVDRLLSNTQAGLIDLNLKQEQKVLAPASFIYEQNDFSVGILYGKPRKGQTLEEVREQLLEQIALLKNGAFDEFLVEAVANDYKKYLITQYENNDTRVDILVEVATNPNLNIGQQVHLTENMLKLRKADIVSFVKAHYTNYVSILKRKGDRKGAQIEKPHITKLTLNKGQQSPFAQDIVNRTPTATAPVFLDYQKDIQTFTAKNGRLPVRYIRNEENDRFSIYYYSDLSNRHDPKARVALQYLDYLAPEGMSPDAFKKALFKIGCEYHTSSNQDRSFVHISGLSKHAVEAVQLVERLLANPTPDPDVWQKRVAGMLKERADNMTNRAAIRKALFNYSLYGPTSPFTNVLSNKQLNSLTPAALIESVHNFRNTAHRVLYYGPMKQEELVDLLDKYHQIPDTLQPLKEVAQFSMLDVDKPQVFYTNYDMVQTEIIFSTPGDLYDPSKTTQITFYNETFGSGMSAIVFRELREARALAYATYATYKSASRVNDHGSYFAYIGTQSDKQQTATDAMFELIREFPVLQKDFQVAQKAILSKIRNQRIIRDDILFNYEHARRLGLDYDLRRTVFDQAQTINLEEIRHFHATNIKPKSFVLAVLGDEKNLNMRALEQHGPVRKLSLREVFGYE